MRFAPLLLLAPLALGACSSKEEFAHEIAGDKAGGLLAEASAATATASTGAAAGAARSVAESTNLYTFTYVYPAAAGAIPDLKALLDARLDKGQSEVKADAEKAQAEAAAGGYPYRPYSFDVAWKVVANLPGFLSLSAETATYTGGAHGNYGLESLVWDKQAKQALDGAALFSSPDALDAALGKKLCTALNAERVKRRGPGMAGGGGVFDDCPKLSEATVLVGSANGQTFDRIGIWFGPYVAGAYAEGAYELNFPVDRAILDAVRPQYRNAFSIAR